MYFVYFFTGMDIVFVLFALLIMVYGLDMALTDAVAWIGNNFHYFLIAIAILALISGIVTQVISKDVRKSFPLFTCVGPSVVAPILIFVEIVLAGFEGGFFTKLIAIVVGVLLTLLSLLVSILGISIAYFGVKPMLGIVFDFDTDDNRSLPTFFIENILVTALQLGIIYQITQ